MKKLVMAAAVLGAFAGAAQAQTSVTLNGIADGDIRFDHTNIGTLKSVGSGGESGSRWGIRGTEDLGGGLKANFIFEQGIDISDNSSPQGSIGGGASLGPGAVGGTNSAPHSSSGSRLFGRIATVGLSGAFGEVRFGRGYNPLFLVQATADPFGAGFVGQVSNIYVNNSIRNDNAIYYDTPRFSGFQLSGVYQFGESTTNNTTPVAGGQAKRGNDRYGAGATYANGPIYVGIGYEQRKANFDNYRVRTGDVAATYDFGIVKLHALYWRTRDDNPVVPVGATPAILASQVTLHESAYNFGVTVPFGAWTFLGQYGHLNDKSSYNSGLAYGNPKVNYYSAGFRYSLSKRTILYGAYSRFNLKTGSQGQAYSQYAGIADASNSGLYAAGNLFTTGTGTQAGIAQPNVNPYSYQFGIRHSF